MTTSENGGPAEGPSSSVTKTMTSLLAIPANRCCAECRIALVDPSQVYASYCLGSRALALTPETGIRIYDFARNHKAFAPPDSIKEKHRSVSEESADSSRSNHADPAVQVNEKMGGHCVFICKACSEAHKSLGTSITTVHAVQDSEAWTPKVTDFLQAIGGNARSWNVYERYITDDWKERRPTPESVLQDRLLFCRAKYEALAFALPPMGPLAKPLWNIILDRNRQMKPYLTDNLRNLEHLALVDTKKSKSFSRKAINGPAKSLPNRLVDYFCVVKSSMKLIHPLVKKDLSKMKSLDQILFSPKVCDCFPSKTAHNDTEFPEHLASFVLPEGCVATTQQLPPMFFSIVLTTADGQRLHGCVLRVYDEQTDMHTLTKAIKSSGYSGELPEFLISSNRNDVIFFPKCLVVMSHYAFHNLFRDALLRLYRITLIEAPLPIERYIANFVSEVPLPPKGRIRIEFAFSGDKVFSVERPPPNQLPLADISFRPLFAALSVGNIITIMGCLMEECHIAILSSHVSMLCPITQALLTVIFPFEWQGLYVPVLPSSMYDILDAPVPFLVGLDSRYLAETEPARRPPGVIFVDVDRDIIHLGFHDDGNRPKQPPPLPHQNAMKLKQALNEHGGSVYIIPDSGIKGCIMTGTSQLLINTEREAYAHMTNIEVNAESMGRKEIFAYTDKAYSTEELASKIDLSVHGQFTDDTRSVNSSSADRDAKVKPKYTNTLMNMRFGKPRRTSMEDYIGAREQGHLLDATEPEGFSSKGIREAFLRYFTTVFNGYKNCMLKNKGNSLFKDTKFLEDQNLPKRTVDYLHTVLETQLFQAFLEERANNPKQSEVRFFDESIFEKNNRSRVYVLRNGGKKTPTPFLDDDSFKVTKSYIAPKPSNIGLPAVKKVYHYGTFPPLNLALIGKIRPPMTWTQFNRDSFRNRLTQSHRVLVTQQEIVRKAMKPIVTAQLAIFTMAKRSAKDLESALVALGPLAVPSTIAPVNLGTSMVRKSSSGSFGKNGKKMSPKGKVKKDQATDSTRGTSSQVNKRVQRAEALLLDARRKQAILLFLVTKLQRCCREYLARRKRQNYILEVQIAGGSHADLDLYKQIRAAIAIEKYVRSFLAVRAAAKKVYATVLIQTWARGYQSRIRYQRFRHAAILIQAHARTRRAAFLFQILRALVSKVQAQIRGRQLRKRLQTVLQNRLNSYKKQIFSLWCTTSTTLGFRTKCWPMFDWPMFDRPMQFLLVGMAETELLRLWKVLGVSTEPKKETIFGNVDVDGLGDKIDVKDLVYRRCLEIQGLVDKAQNRKEHFDLFPSYRNENDLKFEEAERQQVYERLNLTEPEKALDKVFNSFAIGSEESLRKDKVSRIIWSEFAKAKQSESTMNMLFPELKSNPAIIFKKPTGKSQRRFSSAKKWKDCQSPWTSQSWDEISLNGRIKNHVNKAALLIVSHASKRRSFNPDNSQKIKAGIVLRQKRSYMQAHGQGSWPECRRTLIQHYINVD